MSEEPTFVKVAECLYRNRSSGTYFALVKKKGKQIRRSLKTKDRKLAERRLRDFRAKVGKLTAPASERKVPLSAIAERWLEGRNPSLKESSATRNRCCWNQLCHHFGEVPVANVTSRLCEDWAIARGSQISASSFNKELEVLRAIVDYAVREGLILDNPANEIDRRKVVSRKVVIPTKDEFRTILAVLEASDRRSLQARNLTELLAYSGMRVGEATRLLWREVDFEGGRFKVSGGDRGTKSHEERVVPLFPSLRLFLERLHSDDSDPCARVISISSAKSALASACRSAGLQNFTHHSLRHYFVSNAIEVGVDFKTISYWVGHNDGGIQVAKRYGHLRQTHSDQMALLM